MLVLRLLLWLLHTFQGHMKSWPALLNALQTFTVCSRQVPYASIKEIISGWIKKYWYNVIYKNVLYLTYSENLNFRTNYHTNLLSVRSGISRPLTDLFWVGSVCGVLWYKDTQRSSVWAAPVSPHWSISTNELYVFPHRLPQTQIEIPSTVTNLFGFCPLQCN